MTQRILIVLAIVVVFAICFVFSARKKPIVLSEARAEVDAQVIGEYSIVSGQWPSDSLSREFKQEPEGM